MMDDTILPTTTVDDTQPAKQQPVQSGVTLVVPRKTRKTPSVTGPFKANQRHRSCSWASRQR